MVDSGTGLRGEIPQKFFLCDSFCGHFENVDLDSEEGPGRPPVPSLDHSLAHVRSLYSSVSARSLCTCLEREGQQTRKSDRRDLLKWTSFVCLFFSLHCETVAC